MGDIKDRALLLAFRVLPAFMTPRLASRFKPSKGARTTLFRRQAAGLSSLMRSLHFGQDMLVRGDGSLFVYSDGVLLNAAGTNRYLKVTTNDAAGNQGVKMAATLARLGINEPRVVLDVGANFGEISLFFSRKFPTAKVVAVEPSTENLRILRSNLSIQAFPTDNISVVHAAVSDRDGTVQIGTGRGSENSIVVEHQRRDTRDVPLVEDITAVSLTTLFEQENIDHADFIKIDVEGAEPLLLAGLMRLSSRISAVLIELGTKQPPEAYLPFFDQLETKGFSFYTEDGSPVGDAAAAKVRYLQTRARGSGEDYWFVRKS